MRRTLSLRTVTSSRPQSLKKPYPPPPPIIKLPPNASPAVTALLTAPSLETRHIRKLLSSAVDKCIRPDTVRGAPPPLSVKLKTSSAVWRFTRPHRLPPGTEQRLQNPNLPLRPWLLRRYLLDGGTADRGALWVTPTMMHMASQVKSQVMKQKTKRRIREAVRTALAQRGLGFDGRPKDEVADTQQSDRPKSAIWGTLFIDVQAKTFEMPWPELVDHAQMMVDKLIDKCGKDKTQTARSTPQKSSKRTIHPAPSVSKLANNKRSSLLDLVSRMKAQGTTNDTPGRSRSSSTITQKGPNSR